MSLRTELLPLADDMRALRGPEPDGLDIETVKLDIVKRVWNGGRRGADGGYTDTVFTDLSQRYKQRVVTTREVASSNGRYEMGNIKIGPITPAYTDDGGGGYTTDQLLPTGVTGTEYIYRLSGAVTGDYAIINLESDRPFHFSIVVRSTTTT